MSGATAYGLPFLFIGGPLDGQRRLVPLTEHGPERILEIPHSRDIPDLSIVDCLRYIRIPLHENDGKIHFVYQHEKDHRNLLAALIEGYVRP